MPQRQDFHSDCRLHSLRLRITRLQSFFGGAAAITCLIAAAQSPPPTDYNKKFEAWLRTPDAVDRVKAKITKREFEWLDATPGITLRDGVKYRDPAISPWRFTIVALVDEARAKAIERHFGVSMDAIQFAYTTPEEKARCQRLEQKKLSCHGMVMTPTADDSIGMLQADFQWLVDSCKEQVELIAESIIRETDRVMKESQAPRVVTARDKVAAIFRFIQGIPYQTIDDLPDGKDRCGMRTPLITLLSGGDCDSKSALMAALIRSMKIADVVIVTLKAKDGSGHALLGARIDVRQGDRTIKHNGKTYVLIEAATSDTERTGNLAELGEVGPDWANFESRPHEVTEVR